MRRERLLGPRERAQLARFLTKAVEHKSNERGYLSWHGVAAIRLLSMTGMRRDEVLDLTWDMVDERHRCFRLPDSKTGQNHDGPILACAAFIAPRLFPISGHDTF